MGLLFTLILGIFIIIGSLITIFSKNNNKFITFSISLAFSVIMMLIAIDLIPEIYELIDSGNIIYNLLYILIGGSIGFLILKILDHFIPDHDDDLSTHEDDEKNYKHIGLVTAIALIIHNIVEGMAIYLLVTSDLKAGILASIGVGLHNIPLGMIITSSFYHHDSDRKQTFFIITCIALSTFIGGLLIFTFNLNSILDVLESISLTLTLGMLTYILIMELLPKVIHTDNKKITLIGIITGIILLIISSMLG